MKENNLQKKPSSAREYANLFLLDENGKKRDFSNVKNVCLITIGYAETSWILLQEFMGKNITIIDRKSEIDYIETLIKIHKRNDIRIIRKEVETDEEVHSTILKLNMNMFDLIIANLPFGSHSNLSKKMVNELLENKVAEEMIVLAPPKTFWDLLPHLDSFHIVGNISGLFDTTSKESGDLLSCGLVKEEKIKDPKYTHQYDLAQITDKQRQLMKAVEKYNSTHEPFYAELMRQMTLNNKKFYPNVNEDLIFTVPIYTPHDKVHANDSADRRHNLERKPVEWRDSSSCDYGILFKDDISYKNFCNWWYKVPGMYGESEKTFLWNSLEVLLKCFGCDPSIKKYPLTFPHLDWSHPWTDQEILAELGLPEDFLEKEEC